jgi:hypothetical protein
MTQKYFTAAEIVFGVEELFEQVIIFLVVNEIICIHILCESLWRNALAPGSGC